MQAQSTFQNISSESFKHLKSNSVFYQSSRYYTILPSNAFHEFANVTDLEYYFLSILWLMIVFQAKHTLSRKFRG